MATAATSGSATRSAPRRQEAGGGRSVLPTQRHPAVSASAARQLEASGQISPPQCHLPAGGGHSVLPPQRHLPDRSSGHSTTRPTGQSSQHSAIDRTGIVRVPGLLPPAAPESHSSISFSLLYGQVY